MTPIDAPRYVVEIAPDGTTGYWVRRLCYRANKLTHTGTAYYYETLDQAQVKAEWLQRNAMGTSHPCVIVGGVS